jgi:hypothetical protein
VNPRLLILTAALLAGSTSALALPQGDVVLRNGTRLEDVEYQIQGDRVRVKLKFGERIFSMSEIQQLIPRSGGGEAGGVEEDAEDSGWQDWSTRFRISELEGWEAAPAQTPLVRVRLRHEEHDAELSVSVRPADSPWTMPAPGGGRRGGVNRAVADAIQGDLSNFYAKVGRAAVEVGAYQGTHVYRVSGATVTGYRAGTRQLTEVRFRRHGLEYSVGVSVAEEDAGALGAEVDRALGAFSFLPALTASQEVYSDFVYGFRIARANEGWSIRSTPFDEERPVRLTTADGRGEVEVRALPGRSAAQAVQKLFAERGKGRHFVKRSEAAGELHGVSVQRFAFEDFKSGGRKKLLFQGFAAAVQGRVLLFTGISPLTDDDAEKIEGEVGASLSTVRLYDPAVVRSELTRSKEALAALAAGHHLVGRKKYAEAIQQYDDALAAAGDFALAYYLRGQARKLRSDFKGYQADLEKADELDPAGGYAADLGDLVREEAEQAMKRKDWATAVDGWRKVVASDPRDKKALDSLSKSATSLWGTYKRGKKVMEGVEVLEEKLKGSRKNPAIVAVLARVYRDAGNDLIRSGNLGDAKKVAREFKRLARSAKDDKLSAEAKRLEERIKRGR